MNFKVGKRIKEIRKAKKLTQEELAEKIGVDSKYISRIETSLGTPSLDVIERIAFALDIEIKNLFETDYPNTKNELDTKILAILSKLDLKSTKIIYKIIQLLDTV